MIFVNNKLVELPAALRAELINEIGEKGKKIIYPKEFRKKTPVYSQSGTPTGQYIEEKPVQRSFPMRTQLRLNLETMMPDPKGAFVEVVVGRAEKVEAGMATKLTGERFEKPKTLKGDEYETFWYLKYICPFVKNSVSFKRGGVYHFEIEDKATESKQNLNAKKQRSKVEYLLSHDESETGLTDKKIIELAYIYGVQAPKEYIREELCDIILKRVETDERTKEFSVDPDKKGYEFFTSIIQDKTEATFRVAIQKAIDEEIISFDVANSSWRYVNDKRHIGTNAYYGGVILKVATGLRPYPALIDKLRKDRVLLDNLIETLRTPQGVLEDIKVTKDASEDGEASEIDELRTIANGYKKEGNYDLAIKAFEELRKKDKARAGYYAIELKRCKEFLESKGEL